MADIAKISLEIDSAPLARGVAQARKLLEELKGAGEGAGRGVGGAGSSGRKAGDEFAKGAANALKQAQALAALQRATGDYSGAVKTLSDQLGKLEKGSTAAIRVQTQLANVQNQARRAADGTNFDGLARSIQGVEKNVSSLGDKLRGLQSLGNLPGLGGLGRLAGDASNVTSALEGAGAAGGRLGIALGVTGGVIAGAAVGMVALAKNAADYSVEVAKASRATGLTTDSLQGLALEGRTVGADFKDVIDIVNQFSTQLGDARGGSKELQTAFKSVGIDAKTFGGGVNEAMDIALRGIAKLPPGLQKTIAASRLFGEEGARQILSMKNLEGGLTGLSAKYQALGSIISQQAIAEGERFNRNLAELQVRLEAFRNTIGNSVIPAINNLADAYRNFLTGIDFRDPQAALKQIGQSFSNAAARTAGRSIADGIPYGPDTPPSTTRTSGLGAATPAGTKRTARVSVPELSPEIAAQMDFLSNAAKLAGQDIEGLRKAYQDNERNIAIFNASLRLITESGQTTTREYEQAVDNVVKAYNERAALLNKLALPDVQLDRLGLQAAAARPRLPETIIDKDDKKAILNLATSSISPDLIAEQVARQAQKAAQAISDARTAPTFKEQLFGSTFTDLSGNKRRTEGAGELLTQDFLRGILSGREGLREAGANTIQGFADFFGDFAARKITDVLRKQLEKSFEALYDFLGGVLGKLFKSITSKFGGVLGDFFGGIFSSFGGFRADGGDIQPGKFYVVGEKGPELLAARQPAYVVPNGAAFAGAGGGGGGPTIVHAHFHGVTDMGSFQRNQNEVQRRLAAGVEQGQRMKGAR